MNNYSDLVNQLNFEMNEINKLLDTEIVVKMNDKSHDLFPSMGQRGEWNHNIKRLVHEYIKNTHNNLVLYQASDLMVLLDYLIKLKSEINDTLSTINNDSQNNYQLLESQLQKIKTTIINAMNPNDFRFEFKEEIINSENILKIYNSIHNHLPDFDISSEILNFLNTTDDIDKKKYLIKNLIDLYNLRFDKNYYNSGRNTEKLIQKIMHDIKPSNTEKVSQLLNETNKMVVHVKENLGLSKNEKLLMIFKNEAIELGGKIDNLNTVIIGILSLLIIGFLTMIINVIFPTDLKHYLFYVSLLVAISILLTYLIKDRLRLIEFQNYCKRMYMEITALPDYMATLTPEQQEALRISLSSNYFTGNLLASTSNSQQGITDTVSTIEALSKIIQNIKPNIKE